MLRWVHIARLAYNHSPEKEQRLLQLVQPDPNSQANQLEVENAASASANVHHVELSDRQKFHDAIFHAIQPDAQKDVLRDYLPEIEKKIGKIETEKLNDAALDDVIQLARIGIIEELNTEESDRRQLATVLKNTDSSEASDDEMRKILEDHRPLIEKYFKIPDDSPAHAIDLLQALLHTDIERIRKVTHERQTGIKWHHLQAAAFEKEYRRLRKVKPEESVRVPSAFAYGDIMYFNVDHPDFSDPAHGEVMAERAVTHEATHLALSLAENRHNLKQWTSILKGHPRWKDLSDAVAEVFKSDPDYLDTGSKNEHIAGEALAIYTANTRHPSSLSGDAAAAQEKVCAIMQNMFDTPHTGYLTTLKGTLDAAVSRFVELEDRNDDPDAPPTLGKLLSNSAKDSRNQRMLEERLTGDTVPNAEGVETNADEGVEEAKNHLKGEEETGPTATPESILSSAASVTKKIGEMREEYPAIRSSIEASDGDKYDKDELFAAVDQNLEHLSQQSNDITLITHYAEALKRWNLSARNGGYTAEEKSELMEKMHLPSNPYKNMTGTMEEADKASLKNRQELLSIMKEAVSTHAKTLEAMDAALTAASKEKNDKNDGSDSTTWQWLKKNVFSSQGSVKWMSALNIMSVIKIYKDAIVQNYQANQKVKENAFAKNLNVYKPIQHTLNKLARSANNTETSEFAEYIEKEGFTFDDVFGPDGKGLSQGLLYDNRHNYNRAKAVLEYAADHAWLYFMNGLDGHNVYGVDVEALDGHQSFEELVQRHEEGKSKQIDHGHERVDKYPDVAPIMKTMVHELRQKNIFAVQGIMKRLQDKAKYSHSNTWMLTTLLMLIRDECGNDPTLKYCLDKGMIDNISNHTIQQSAWSITWLKMRRHDIMKWKDDADPKAKFGNNILTETMETIEADLAKAGCNFPDTPEGRMAKYEAIGMVLAGKTFSLELQEARDRGLLKYGMKPGASISIFQSKHDKYRADFDQETEQASSSPKETDPDYFNVRVGGSDVMLLNRAMTFKILEKTSTGTWTFKTQAEGFIGQIIDRHEELGEIDPKAQKNFEKEMRAKISDWWNGTDNSRKNQFFANKDQRNRLMWKEFLERNLLDKQARANLQKTFEDNYFKGLPAGTPEKDKAKKKIIEDTNALFEKADVLAVARNVGD